MKKTIILIVAALAICLSCGSKDNNDHASSQSSNKELYFLFNQDLNDQTTFYKAASSEADLKKILTLKKLRVLSLSETTISDLRALAELPELEVLVLRKSSQAAFVFPDTINFSIITDRDDVLALKKQLAEGSFLVDSRNGCELQFFRGFFGGAYSQKEYLNYLKPTDFSKSPLFKQDFKEDKFDLYFFDGSNDKVDEYAVTNDENRCDRSSTRSQELLQYFNAN